MRILTYNIRHGTDVLGRRRLGAQAAVIRAAAPDVVLLQEAERGTRRNGGDDLPARLSELSGLPHVAFGPNQRRDGGEYGNAILSRWSLSGVTNHAIPSSGRPGVAVRLREERGILEAVVDHPSGRIRVLCAHFGFSPGESVRGARRALELIGRGSDPLVLGGDLNSLARSACHRLLQTELVDCAREADIEQPTFPAPWPRLRLDCVYARGMTVGPVQVLATQASDHRPLLVELVVVPTAAAVTDPTVTDAASTHAAA